MKVLILGGTGTLGTALIEHYYKNEDEIICFSRDELKQQQLKKKFPEVRYVLGDIRSGIDNCGNHIDLLYHVAALKHIDVLEQNIMEAMKTNVQGTIHAAHYAIENEIPRMAFASTDKAVLPINVYGYTKALSEKYLEQLNKTQSGTAFHIFRWGNVIGSRGSVVNTFKESLLKGESVSITDPDMTRFWIRLDHVVNFMIEGMNVPYDGHTFHIPHMKSAKVMDLASAIAHKLGIKKIRFTFIEMRPGEKLHENITPYQRSDEAERYTQDELLTLLEGAV